MTSTSRRPRAGPPSRLRDGAPRCGDPVSQRPEFMQRRLDCGRWGYWMPACAGMTIEELTARPAFPHEVIE